MSSPSTPPYLPASLLPVDPDSKLLFWKGRASVGLTSAELEGILERARSDDFYLGGAGIRERTALRVLALAIDPDTGDSLLHIAASSFRPLLAVQEVIGQTEQRSCGLDRTGPSRHCALESVMIHQNYAGDSVLHIAAHRGVQKIVTYLYRTFCHNRSNGDLDLTEQFVDGEPSGLPEFDPAEEFLGDEEIREQRLAFLTLPNAAGLTAADVARFVGHDDVAGWLDRTVSLLDPDGDFTPEDIPRVIKEASWRNDCE